MMKSMKFSRNWSVFLGIAGGLLAQAPPPKPASPPPPSVTMTAENPKPAPVVPPDKVVVSVGDVKITAAQFDLIIDSLPEQSRASARGPARKMFADQLVRLLVLAQEGRRRKLDDGAAYRVQTMIQNANLLAGLTFAEISKETKLGDADVRNYYEAHKTDYEEAHARHILIRVQGSPIPVKPGQKDLTDAEALAKAQEIRKKLADGGDFAALALSESDDPQSAAKGGDLGTFKKGTMVPAFEDATFKMAPGELSQPVRSQLGYHVIKLESKTGGKTFEEARPELEKKMRPEMAQKALEDLQKGDSVSLDPDFFGLAKQ
jgi:peptidyl-prolyl cis-trans isomerase C